MDFVLSDISRLALPRTPHLPDPGVSYIFQAQSMCDQYNPPLSCLRRPRFPLPIECGTYKTYFGLVLHHFQYYTKAPTSTPSPLP